MSWGGGEFSGETSDDSDFDQAGVAFVASSGDAGAPAQWPAASPNVLSVGGTALTLAASNVWSSEAGWSGSGGGPSAYESQPSYQTGVVTQTSTARATPDVAYDASPSTGVAVYDSVPIRGRRPSAGSRSAAPAPGHRSGRRSWRSPTRAAPLSGQPALDSTSPQQVMDILYQNPADFHDITSGTSTGNPDYSAGPGYDYVTGLGSPMANLVVGSLGRHTTRPARHAGRLTAPSRRDGRATRSASPSPPRTPSGTTDTGFTGTIRIHQQRSPGRPAGNFHLHQRPTMERPRSRSRSRPPAASRSPRPIHRRRHHRHALRRSASARPPPASSSCPAFLDRDRGRAQTFTVTAEDPYGNVATGYTGTVEFTSSDTAAILPGNTPSRSANQGVQTFSVTFETAGTQSVTVTDTATRASRPPSRGSASPRRRRSTWPRPRSRRRRSTSPGPPRPGPPATRSSAASVPPPASPRSRRRPRRATPTRA